MNTHIVIMSRITRSALTNRSRRWNITDRFSDKINWDSINDELMNYNWIREFKGLDADKMLDKFLSICLSITEEKVPKRNARSKSKIVIPRDRKILMRSRKKLIKKIRNGIGHTKRQSINKKLTDIEKNLKLSREHEQSKLENTAIKRIKDNSKYFFAYAKSFSKIKIGIGPLVDAKNKLTSCSKQMAEILSKQYSSVFSKPKFESNQNLFTDNDDTNNNAIKKIYFSEEDIIESIQSVSNNSAAGPDGFPAMFLKQTCHSISFPLAIILRKSFETGTVPPVFKRANITPIYKGNGKAIPKNYRPVALTSQLSKIFEKVIRKNLVDHLEEHNRFNSNQHGFRKGRSCLSQLLEHFDRITRLLEEGKMVDVIYLDFAKAFDKVDIGIVIRKLKCLGVQGQIGRWIQNFLTNRSQSVVVAGYKSDPSPVLSGVPQGSVLGPLLFLILIGDIDRNIVESFISSFADDTRVGNGIENNNDIINLQTSLNEIYEWALINNMEFNSDKFEYLRYKALNNFQSHEYIDNNNQTINEKYSVKDLGVIMSNDATFTAHINLKVTNIKSKISWILRTFKSRATLPMLTLWKTLILCEHDYCSQLWSPNKVGDIQKIEVLQRCFLRKITEINQLSYWNQLKKLKLYSLERRRERYSIIYVWKMLEGMVPNSMISSYYNERRGRLCHVPSISSSAPGRIKTIRFSSFAVRGPRLFNSIPKDIRNLKRTSTDIFKRKLDEYLRSIPDEPLIPGYTAFRRISGNSLIQWSSYRSVMRGFQDEDHEVDLSGWP